ncbi:hypothetical protein E1B28_008724 [Marasmius oreades]|uniref:Rab-GAP TBC domain-containing protein n=1 Tax=Marasmius oreades TaxID=181124 RepID=A0A9P7RZN4_9AGAR|nr:uncharacterized protein E1B28_008724 [Marasmius oreades]KAG7092365.1 hypothetical protein E1B28_008724 [Marasmius oreades]
MATAWDLTSVKALLRTASQRLGQLQDKIDAKGTITRKEIASSLQKGNVTLARMKARTVMQEDAFGDVLEMLEMHVAIMLEHVSEIGQNCHNPAVVEAASSIIFAAPHVDLKELHDIRDLLLQRMGTEFSRAAVDNREGKVSIRITKALSTTASTTAQADELLLKIAKSHNVDWSPDPPREDIQKLLLDILNPDTLPVVDIAALRKLCARGIPDKPSWLRPKIWKLFFGTLPVLKASWHRVMNQQRSDYYELVKRLLEPIANLPPPTIPIHPLDSSLLQASRQLYDTPPKLFNGLGGEQPDLALPCPLEDTAPPKLKLQCAKNLDIRLKAILGKRQLISGSVAIPEIRLETGDFKTPLTDWFHGNDNINERHNSAMLRLLYLHSFIKPGNRSPHVPTLLAPIYSALNQQVEVEDLAHVEADTFWLFEAIIAEFSDLEDEEGSGIWMKKFSERLAWADNDLWQSLAAIGLDPAQPHYSYGWLGPLLAYTFPYEPLIIAWDAIFSCQPRQRQSNARLDMLLNVCTSLLIRVRVRLLTLGKSQQRSQIQWGQELPPSSPLRPWELGDAFSEGLSFLQNYRIEPAGGIDRVLQLAVEFKQRREEEARASEDTLLPLGARLRVTMWKGFTNQLSSPDRSPVASDDEAEVEDGEDETDRKGTGNSSVGLTSRLASTVWRGITNQSSMEPPPTPVTPSSSAIPISSRTPSSDLPSNERGAPSSSAPPSNPNLLWDYAEKLKESDAAATFAKVSSNWRAKALMTTWGRRHADSNDKQDATPINASAPPSPLLDFRPGEARRGSLPDIDPDDPHSPPPRPSHFRPPRDTIIFSGPGLTVAPSSPELSPQSDSAILQKTKNLTASLAALTRSEGPETLPKPKAGPRPLLLNSSSLMTVGRDRPLSRSENSTPVLGQPSGQWSHVTTRRRLSNRDSLSSMSSLSPSDAFSGPVKSGWDSDGSTSRKVPLNRTSVSPMAPHSRTSSFARLSQSSGTSSISTPSKAPLPGGWSQVDIPDSPSIPRTPIGSPSYRNNVVTINEPEESSLAGSVVSSPTIMPMQHDKSLTRITIPSSHKPETTSESSAPETPHKSPRSPRIRSKRHPSRPTNLRLQDPGRRSPNLAVDWPLEHDAVLTPKATEFDGEVLSSSSNSPTSQKSPRPTRQRSGDTIRSPSRKLSTEGQEPRSRKISTGSRTKRGAGTEKAAVKRIRDSGAEEGDDEGYDDLLSAYESEESKSSVR